MKHLLVLGLAAVASAQFFGGGPSIDGNFGNSEYNYSWLHDGGVEYPQANAVAYCNSLGRGWAPVSIETPEEDAFVTGIVGSYRLKYLWTGGVRSGFGWAWLSGGPFSNINWSFTGGFQRPQPDNREGNENCLAILNNFYQDGIKWHDVACHHVKPTICERQASNRFF